MFFVMEILKYPHPLLRKLSKTVNVFDTDLKALADSMVKIMYVNSAVGLSAPQVGHLMRLIVIDISPTGNEPLILVNPVIDKKGPEKQNWQEGCLSFPGIYQTLSCAKSIGVTYQDVEGQTHTMEVDSLKAVAIQHEIDHLNGILFIDRMSPKTRVKIKNKALGGK